MRWYKLFCYVVIVLMALCYFSGKKRYASLNIASTVSAQVVPLEVSTASVIPNAFEDVTMSYRMDWLNDAKGFDSHHILMVIVMFGFMFYLQRTGKSSSW